MKPTFDDLKIHTDDVPDELIHDHLNRLDLRYYQRFDQTHISRHLAMISKLSSKVPVQFDIQAQENNLVAITICSYDYPAVFSIIAGLLGSQGFDVVSGGIHTYSKTSSKPIKTKSKLIKQSLKLSDLSRRKIIDHFVGRLDTTISFSEWATLFLKELNHVIGLLEHNQAEQAKHLINEKVAKHLSALQTEQWPILFPVEITIDNHDPAFTRLKVVSEDTPVFLYAFSNALSLHGLSIEHIKIKTSDNRVEDTIDFVDRSNKKIEDTFLLDQVKLSLILTKQFTYFLSQAPDPYAALSRFEFLVDEIIKKPKTEEWTNLISSPTMMQELAKVLGASDYLWEDMIRQQYETLLPLLKPAIDGQNNVHAVATLPDRLEAALEHADNYEDQNKLLNEFKDKEIFRFDLDYILSSQTDFKKLSDYLTFLAEVILKKTIIIVYEHLVKQYGYPRTVAGLETKFAVLGLGKLGGAALGYASDIELMFVYSDQGQTDGNQSIDNKSFYEYLVKEITKFIHAKREGIFKLDLRLRPYGTDGALASSLKLFCDYYGHQGPAHAIEKLALVRMRAIAGDQALGKQLERLRDEFIYATRDVNLKDFREMRLKQFADKIKGNRINAKFSPGALVDLEYDVQILQIMHGHDYTQLRTPRIHLALKGLNEVGVLDQIETMALTAAYGFLRHLINGLRMLRGSAKDLFLPTLDSLEYTHLARRLGYVTKEGLEPAKQLHIDFETHTATIRAFVEKHFGRDALPGQAVGNVADLMLSVKLNQSDRLAILKEAGFKNPERADINFKQLAGSQKQKNTLARLIVLAADLLKQKPDPDMALNNWEHFVSHISDPTKHFTEMINQPMRLTILLDIFATSQFLSDALVNHPEYLATATDPETLYQVKKKSDFERELKVLQLNNNNEQDWLNAIRLFRRQAFLRIGTKDICLKTSMEDITLELSNLADALCEIVMDQIWTTLQLAGKSPPASWVSPDRHFCLLAFGKLGGQELNYSSDIDLVALYDDRMVKELPPDDQQRYLALFALVTESLRHALSAYTEQGYVYRVDFRLRPHGIAGQLVTSLSSLIDYYHQHAALSEIQSLIKMRCIAGNHGLGLYFLEQIRSVLHQEFSRDKIIESIEFMRNHALKKISSRPIPVMDVKSGKGGIRDIEFLVQGLQLIHSNQVTGLIEGNSFKALKKLLDSGIINGTTYINLKEDYSYLRRLEHFLQIYEDRQTHTLPHDQEALDALAKRNLGRDSHAKAFIDDLKNRLNRVRGYYKELLLDQI